MFTIKDNTLYILVVDDTFTALEYAPQDGYDSSARLGFVYGEHVALRTCSMKDEVNTIVLHRDMTVNNYGSLELNHEEFAIIDASETNIAAITVTRDAIKAHPEEFQILRRAWFEYAECFGFDIQALDLREYSTTVTHTVFTFNPHN